MREGQRVMKKNIFDIFLKPTRRKFKNALIQFCGRGLTGNVLAKLTDGNIVYIETTEKVMAADITEDKEDIPLELCLEFVASFLGADFFGEIVTKILCGRITDIKVKKTLKPGDIEKFLSGDIGL